MKYLIAPISFLLFILLIILLANLGLGPTIWGFINNIPQGDKFFHFLLYGLTLLSIESFWKFKHLGFGFTITTFFAVTEEFSQIFIVSRTFSLLDLFWSIAGITLFECLILLSKLKVKNRV